MDIVTTSEFEEEISLQSAFDIYATYQHILQNEEVRLKVASIARHDLKDAYVLDIDPFGGHTCPDRTDHGIGW